MRGQTGPEFSDPPTPHDLNHGLAFRLDSGDLISIGEEKSASASLYETAQYC